MARRSIESKRKDLARGAYAELAAALALRLKGYRIIARGWRCRHGEIDIIARRGQLICFVEVKARPSLVEAATSITGEKRARLQRAIRSWLSAQRRLDQHSFRADAMLVTPWRWPRHVPDVMTIEA